MKFGKSLLLGELLTAEQVAYSDVSQNRFWVVCPACTEPVFKVVRNEQAERPALHYFSHYEASKAYAADCELRVGRISQRQVEDLAIESRDQKLKFFIANLQRLVHANFEEHWSISPGRPYFRTLKRSSAIDRWRRIAYDLFVLRQIKISSDDVLLSALDSALNNTTEFERQKMTGLSLSTQKRIALDLLRFLTTAPGYQTFQTLFDHAFAWQQQRLQQLFDSQSPETPELVYVQSTLAFLKEIPSANAIRMRTLIAELGRHKMPPEDNLFTTLTASIYSEMFLILARLPYLDILRESLKASRFKTREAICV